MVSPTINGNRWHRANWEGLKPVTAAIHVLGISILNGVPLQTVSVQLPLKQIEPVHLLMNNISFFLSLGESHCCWWQSSKCLWGCCHLWLRSSQIWVSNLAASHVLSLITAFIVAVDISVNWNQSILKTFVSGPREVLSLRMTNSPLQLRLPCG
jgi:hypothetical protein